MAGFDLTLFEKEPVLGIIRGVDEDSLPGVLQAAYSGGLRYLEITLNTPHALLLIKKAIELFPDFCIGAGTVLSAESSQQAIDVGAQFIVAPNLNEQVAQCCIKNNRAYFPGALTPTEIEKAWSFGATMVKVFPAAQMGPGYIKLLKGPFDKIKLMAVGGISPQNIPDYFSAGASAVALGGSIFSTKRMADRAFSVIQKEIEEFMFAVNKIYSNMGVTDIANHSSKGRREA
ncbi:MAG: bifunctional 4-hydroxy-2-oxoglutarate aldolase/2-dehydro-3-deoxy-phosphogluconate aldolase [Nitrospinae bacterium]|nr:bifunctional 4-hydroxy-2-oxoglutarate aldolase/2-dehydro-3-deoxy-phosphogluconate aldolase [Nitrospinota bacterium]MBL7019065.1 bifunctional 4-hydroxy-2-oxoglutarate aldolase/2-dehydro-3-deoxy-phosphogluconate aldolase [Nitrospinaceae bacterium]